MILRTMIFLPLMRRALLLDVYAGEEGYALDSPNRETLLRDLPIWAAHMAAQLSSESELRDDVITAKIRPAGLLRFLSIRRAQFWYAGTLSRSERVDRPLWICLKDGRLYTGQFARGMGGWTYSVCKRTGRGLIEIPDWFILTDLSKLETDELAEIMNMPA